MEELAALSIPHLVQVIPPLMRNSDTQNECTQMILERIRSGSDPENEVSLLLHHLAILATPSASLSKQIMEICQLSEYQIPVIRTISALVRWPQDENALLALYKDLLGTDRKLLVPIVDSLTSLPLSKTSQEELFQIMMAGMDIAEPEDLIVIARGLLSTTGEQKYQQACQSLHNALCELDMDNENIINAIIQLLENSLLSQTSFPCGKYYFNIIATFDTLSLIDIGLLLTLLKSKSQREKSLQVLKKLTEKDKLPYQFLTTIFTHPPEILLKSPRNTLLLFVQWVLHQQNEIQDIKIREKLSHWGKSLACLLFSSLDMYRPLILQSYLSGAVLQPSVIGSQVSLNEARDYALVIRELTSTASTAEVICREEILLSSIQDIVFHPSATVLYIDVTRLLISSLVSLCTFRQGLETSLMIHIQKQLFIASSHDSAIEKGVIVACELIKSKILPYSTQEKLLEGILQNLTFWKRIPNAIFELLLTAKDELLTMDKKIEIFTNHICPLVNQSQIISGFSTLLNTCGIEVPSFLEEDRDIVKVCKPSTRMEHSAWAFRVDRVVGRGLRGKIRSLGSVKEIVINITMLVHTAICFVSDIDKNAAMKFVESLLECSFVIDCKLVEDFDVRCKKRSVKHLVNVMAHVMCIYEILKFLLLHTEAENVPLELTNSRLELLLDLFVWYDSLRQSVRQQEEYPLGILPLHKLLAFNTLESFQTHELNWIWHTYRLVSSMELKGMNSRDLSEIEELTSVLVRLLEGSNSCTKMFFTITELQTLKQLAECDCLQKKDLLFEFLSGLLHNSSQIHVAAFVISVLGVIAKQSETLQMKFEEEVTVFLSKPFEEDFDMRESDFTIGEQLIVNCLTWPPLGNSMIEQSYTLEDSKGGIQFIVSTYLSLQHDFELPYKTLTEVLTSGVPSSCQLFRNNFSMCFNVAILEAFKRLEDSFKLLHFETFSLYLLYFCRIYIFTVTSKRTGLGSFVAEKFHKICQILGTKLRKQIESVSWSSADIEKLTFLCNSANTCLFYFHENMKAIKDKQTQFHVLAAKTSDMLWHLAHDLKIKNKTYSKEEIINLFSKVYEPKYTKIAPTNASISPGTMIGYSRNK